ncbi:uncharacterized protein LOC127246573 [Andrographis paniculata]|uniref:uncharacterized protein LOC127246573 n=1 Tax=Andrographis paniculata TaxID=175694 RepID=UPI0021E8D196|nr:uncharacterized protein LOC127246573 [Andrographis paniculata]
MAIFHVRSNSLPSKSHPLVNHVEDHLQRLKSSEETSTSGTSVSARLASLRELHEGVENLMQMSSIQQALAAEGSEKWTNELLEQSLGLVDLCGFAREVLSLIKGSAQELQSSIRRSRGDNATTGDISAYLTSRKKINKMISKFIKNFKSFNKNWTALLDDESDLKVIMEMLKQTTEFDFAVLKSALMVLSTEKGRSKKSSWSLTSMFTQGVDTADVQNVFEQLKSSELAVQELEEELEAFYRTLVKTRVSLLNVLNH